MPAKTALLLTTLLAVAAAAPALADAYPLFQDNSTLEIVIEAPMKTLLSQAKQKPLLAGHLRYLDADGKEISVPMGITPRGRSRLAFCTFPPLSISFNPAQAEATLFAGQHKLKIGTHCRKGAKFLDNQEQEFGIYRAYNHLTEYSFRVRKLQITYRDTESKRKDEVHPAFFIESEEEAAGRLGLVPIRSPRIRVSQLDAQQTSLSGLFQYLIANTDWDITKGPGTEDCCHNGKVIGKAGAQENWVVLPYDFDQAGLINTDYSMPSPALGIRSVRTRLYRGECRFQDQLPETIELFNAQRDRIEKLLVPETLSASTRKSALKYIGEFYATINDVEKRQKHITSACLKG